MNSGPAGERPDRWENVTREDWTGWTQAGRNSSEVMESTVLASTGESPVTLRALYCRVHRCPAAEFERHLFGRTVRSPWGWVAPLVLRLWPAPFQRDLRELAVAGHAVTPLELREVASEFRKGHDPRERRTFIRDTLGMRISGRKLMAEAQRLWAEAAPGP